METSLSFSYRPEESIENKISCKPLTAEQTQKPAKLNQLEVDSLKLRTESVLEAVWSAGDKPGQVMICDITLHVFIKSFLSGQDRDQTCQAQ